MEEELILSEAAAFEVLAYLITAARTQVEEPPEYGPMRLLTAANRLCGHLAAHGSPAGRELLGALETLPLIATPTADRDVYVARLDEICRVLADCLMTVTRQGDRS